MNVKHIEKEDYSEIIKDRNLLVDFYADWCGPCRMLSPIIEELSNEIEIYKVNVDKREDIAAANGVMTIPTLVFYKNGKEEKRLIGYQDKNDILNEIKKINK